MRRIQNGVLVLLTVLVVLGSVALPAVGVTAAADGPTTGWLQTGTAEESATNGTGTAPGTRLAGSVGTQGAEIGGELETRSFDHQLDRSSTNASKAAVVAQQANQSRARLDALRTQLDELEAAHENGSISDAEYRVRAAQLSARIDALRRVTERTTAAADHLPAETLREKGVNVTALQMLRSETSDLGGPEVAAIAREVTGRSSGGFGPDRAAAASQGQGADAPGRSGDGERRNGAGNETTQGAGESDEKPGANGAGASGGQTDDSQQHGANPKGNATAGDGPESGGNSGSGSQSNASES